MQCSRQCCCVSTSVIMVSSALVAVVSFFVLKSAAGSAFHAECEVDWQVPLACSQVKDGLETMMDRWRGDDQTPLEESGCGTTSDTCPKLPCGQRCLYKFLPDETTATKVYGTHWTPVSRYSDSFNYELTELDGGAKCGVKGYSRSDTWYAVLDYGTNFCNVRNLLDGAFESVWQHPEDVASLDQWQGFSEETNDSRCTQYTSRDCTRY